MSQAREQKGQATHLHTFVATTSISSLQKKREHTYSLKQWTL